MTEPIELARRADRAHATVRRGAETVTGYGVIALPFTSGHVLALRHFPASSFGPGYDSIWDRAPDGRWTVYTSVAPSLSCPRFIGALTDRSVETSIRCEWAGPRTLVVHVAAADLHWEIRLGATPVTRLMTVMNAITPRWVMRNNLALSVMSRMATLMMRAGRFRMNGRMPNGQWFQAQPRSMWTIAESHASIGGVDLGPPGPLEQQASLADFMMPQRGYFMFGGVDFEAFDPARHMAPTESARAEDAAPSADIVRG